MRRYPLPEDCRSKSRSEAIRNGDDHFFSGVPCKSGHIAVRLVTGLCLGCRSSHKPHNSKLWFIRHDPIPLDIGSEAEDTKGLNALLPSVAPLLLQIYRVDDEAKRAQLIVILESVAKSCA